MNDRNPRLLLSAKSNENSFRPNQTRCRSSSLISYAPPIAEEKNPYAILLLLAPLIVVVVHARLTTDEEFIRLPSEKSDSVGTRWAVLFTGSNGYWNYRHQVIIALVLLH
ncbi:hypothetical protein SSX86_015545 [Deinandra increscens subsp. villosa]|uniref:Uncharacterized protein n=1 Tax=Deinandra increscens subsp. villosa TaxID=3103831 RepID=A0AAP0CW95_9ASTR